MEQKDPRVLTDRKRALEEEFFQRVDQQVREKLRAKREQEALRSELRVVLGIQDDALLDAVANLGVGAEALLALAMVPLVEVAWADGKIEPREKQALLEAAHAEGFDQRHPAYSLFEGWLARRPEPRMLEAWTAYIEALAHQLAPDQLAALRERMLARTRRIAESAGGFLGLGAKVSPEEEKVLALLARAFDKKS